MPGKVTIVLLPGMDGTGLLFEEFAALLQPKYNVVVGRLPDKSCDYASLGAHARKLLPDGEPFVLVGESFSGPIAISLAAIRPAGLVGLVLCCTFVSNPHPYMALVPGAWRLPIKAAPLTITRILLMGSTPHQRLLSLFKQAMGSVSTVALQSRLRAVIDVDVATEFSTLRLPILYLRGKSDRVVPRSTSEAMSRSNPSMEIVDIDAPHFLLQTRPHEAVCAITRFIEMATRESSTD